MNFIIEVLKKKEDSSVLVFVVRNQQGFPVLVADSLDEAKDYIQDAINKALEPSKDSK